jgi:L-fuculose-phosphate aldolase
MHSEAYVGRKFRTEFSSQKIYDNGKIAKEFISFCGLLDKNGLTKNNAGNVSVRMTEGMLITAGGSSLRNLYVDDLVQVTNYDSEKNTITAIGTKEPSSESIMHFLIYKNFPFSNAIVHVHDPDALKNFKKAPEMKIAITKKEHPYGTPELALEAVNALKMSSYILLKNHGSLAIGKNLENAVDLVLEIHKTFVTFGK